MYELLKDITCLLWLILAVMCFVGLRRWNKKFSDMYDDLKRRIEEEFND